MYVHKTFADPKIDEEVCQAKESTIPGYSLLRANVGSINGHHLQKGRPGTSTSMFHF